MDAGCHGTRGPSLLMGTFSVTVRGIKKQKQGQLRAATLAHAQSLYVHPAASPGSEPMPPQNRRLSWGGLLL